MKKICLFLILCLLAGFPAAGLSEAPAATAEPVFVDLDLSVMSGTIVYAEVYNLMVDPDPYLGKIIRMAGQYTFYEDTANNIVYHACIIRDATACCAQGIEFVRAGDPAWPDDYPEAGAEITVTGRLELYEENGTLYLHLVDAEMQIM